MRGEPPMKTTRIAVIDVSGSMNQGFTGEMRPDTITRRSDRLTKFEAAKDYLRFAIQKMPSSSNLVIIAFAESARVVYRGAVTDAEAINRSISTLEPNGSRTNLASAFGLVLQLLSTEDHRIRALDVVTDGLSNDGDPIPPARELQHRFGTYIHLYLIDPTDEGQQICRQIVGEEGEGEVDPVSSAATLLQHQRQSLAEEEEVRDCLNMVAARHATEKQRFDEVNPVCQKPRVTAAYPEVLAPGKWRPVDVFLYLSQYDEAVRREIQKLQFREYQDYGTISARLSKPLPAGCPIRIALRSDSIRANPPEVTLAWLEPYNRLSFRITPNDGIGDGSAALLDIEVYADDLSVACMRVPIAVSSSDQQAVQGRCDAQWYNTIFPSYARGDEAAVKLLKERYAALGVLMSMDDLDYLRSGAMCRQGLFKRIDESDVFQLFWSQSAGESKAVEVEWRHALEVSPMKEDPFIRPVYWQRELPKVPDELSRIRFRQISLDSDSKLSEWVAPSIPKGMWSGLKSDALSLLPMIFFDDPRSLEIWQYAGTNLSRHVSHSSFANCLETAETEYHTNRPSSRNHFAAMARAVYDRIKEDFTWSYEWEPYDPSPGPQPVRLIHHVRAERKGTCLELVLAYLGCLEGFHFLPLYVHLCHTSGKGCHALAGYWTIPTSDVLEEREVLDGDAVIANVEGKRMSLVDCTGFADGSHCRPGGSTTVTGKLSFEEAEQFATAYLANQDWKVDFALNVRKARTK